MINIASDSQIPNLESRLSDLFDAEYSLQYFESDQLKSNDLKDLLSKKNESSYYGESEEIFEGIFADAI